MNQNQNEIYDKEVVPAVIGEEVTPVTPQEQPAAVFEGRVTPDLKVEYPGLTSPRQNGEGQEQVSLFTAEEVGQVAVPPIIDHTTGSWFEQHSQK